MSAPVPTSLLRLIVQDAQKHEYQLDADATLLEVVMDGKQYFCPVLGTWPVLPETALTLTQITLDGAEVLQENVLFRAVHGLVMDDWRQAAYVDFRGDYQGGFASRLTLEYARVDGQLRPHRLRINGVFWNFVRDEVRASVYAATDKRAEEKATAALRAQHASLKRKRETLEYARDVLVREAKRARVLEDDERAAALLADKVVKARAEEEKVAKELAA